MIEYDTSAQPRFLEPAYKPVRKPRYIEKQFNEPDFISMNLEDKSKFKLRWATYDDVFQSAEALVEFVESVDGAAGIFKGAVPYNEQGYGIETLPAYEDRVRNFAILTDTIALNILNVDSSPSHQTSTNEVWLNLNRNDTAARYIVSHCIAITARDGVGENADVILDSFAEYVPILRNY